VKPALRFSQHAALSLLGVVLVGYEGPAAAQTTDVSVAQTWGLLGRWARNCQKPPSPGNPYLGFSKAEDGRVDATIAHVSKSTGRLQELIILPDGRLQFVRMHAANAPITNVYAKDQADRIRISDVFTTDATGQKSYGARDGQQSLRGETRQTDWLVRCDYVGA
jgi:hypothetical protein